MKKKLALALATLGVAIASLSPALGSAPAGDLKPKTSFAPAVTPVIFVGNNWAGTADVISAKEPYRRITRINIIPDLDERMAEIYTDPERLAYFLAVREAVGEGHDQFVDDMYTTDDGEILIVSRPSLRDVVGFDLDTRKIIWRFVVDGQRSDHMAVSPNGERVAVSASTGNVVHILNTRTGKEVGRFPSGDSPHENVYSPNGKRIIHASIGRVYTPTDDPAADTSKGARYFEVVKTKTNKVFKRIDMGKRLAQAGYPNMSSAVRPMAIAPKGKIIFFQVSFFHGFVEFSLKKDRVNRIVKLPVPPEVQQIPREQYLLDSAHHGLAIDATGKKLCAAGTMSDYAAIVPRYNTKKLTIIKAGKKPYWATTAANGEWCLVSWSGTDNITIIDYSSAKVIANIPVGDHPQRIRMSNVRKNWIKAQ